MPMSKLLVFQTSLGELKSIPITDETKARKVLDSGLTMKWQGDTVIVKGIMSQEDFEGYKIFYKHEPSHYEQWKRNMEYLKKHKHWPETE